MLKPKTLQQRLLLYMLLPVAGLLLVMGYVIFSYARASIFSQWKEAAVLKLERAARDVDSRLDGPKTWITMVHKTGGRAEGSAIRGWAVKQLEELQAVERVVVTRADGGTGHSSAGVQCPLTPQGEQCFMWSRQQQRNHTRQGSWGDGEDRWGEMIDFHRAEVAGVGLPRYDDLIENETVSLTSDLFDKSGKGVGKLEVVIRFKTLIEGVLSSGWAQSEKAFLISDTGQVLACSTNEEAPRFCAGEAADVTRRVKNGEAFGTIVHPAYAKDEVIGFYRLKEAPWILVLSARAEDIMKPIHTFKLFFVGICAVSFLVILLLIRFVAGRTVVAIQSVSHAANKVARGLFDTIPAANTRDEVGQLIESFNTMVVQLDERIRLKEAMDLAMRVQQNLLPGEPPRIEGLDIAGMSLYCDETGGDYYDFIRFPEWRSERITVAVGDVAGHGISAALFMTTARAMLRSRLSQPGSLGQIMTDVNRLLSADTAPTGDFMTLFLLQADVRTGGMRWVRAGHAPAIVYDRATDAFDELRGEGPLLGFDETIRFQEYEYTGWCDTKVVLIGTDGIWEAENPEGEAYGMGRLRTVLREHARRPAREIVEEVLASVNFFRRDSPQEDDVTLVVLKTSYTLPTRGVMS